MKTNKKIFVGMAVLVLLFGLVLAGCATGKYIDVETETTKEIHQAASELLLSQGGKIKAGELISGLGKKFPGLKKAPMLAIQFGLITVSYQDTSYKIKCTMDMSSADDTGGGTSKAGDDTIVTSIDSVYTTVAAEPAQ